MDEMECDAKDEMSNDAVQSSDSTIGTVAKHMDVREDRKKDDARIQVFSSVSVINMQFRALKKLVFDCNV